MLIRFSFFVAVLFALYGCEISDQGAVQSIADLEARVGKINVMNAELERQKNDLHTMVRQFNATLPETEQFDITSLDTMMGKEERELLRVMFREEKDISYNGLLTSIIDKNNQIADLKQTIAELEEKLPKPYTVKMGDTHYKIVMQYLMSNQNMTRDEAHKIAWKTALIDDILPGNRIWLMYQDGMVGSFVTQGEAKISPIKVMMMSKKRMIEKARSISSLEIEKTNMVGN